MLAEPELQASDLVPSKYEGVCVCVYVSVWASTQAATHTPSRCSWWGGATQASPTKQVSPVCCADMLGWLPAVLVMCPAGGFKLWEGAIDLCNYLIQQHKLTAEGLAPGSSSHSSLRVGG